MVASLHINQFQLEFTDRVQLLLQERGSKLRNMVTIGSHTGSKSASPVNQVQFVNATSPAGRFAPITRTDIQHERRWVDPIDWELATLLDKFDMLKYSQDFQGPYAETFALAMGRAMDDVIIAAAAGSAKIGETGGSTEAFDTATYRVAATVGASAATGLNVPKLIEARRLFAEANVDLDMEAPTLVITPAQEADLLNQIETTNADFNGMKPVLVDGRLRYFMGFNIVVSNRTQAGDVPFGLTSGNRRCFAFVKSGLHLGIWKDVETRVDERKDISSIPYQIYSCASFGATRTEQGKVVEILCAE